ncbi:MAG: hypothetical protein WAV84_16425, partial [Bacteroidota bacterium]
MKSYLFILFILPMQSLQAQDPPDHFILGSWGISPDYVAPSMVGADTSHTVWPVRGVWDQIVP